MACWWVKEEARLTRGGVLHEGEKTVEEDDRLIMIADDVVLQRAVQHRRSTHERLRKQWLIDLRIAGGSLGRIFLKKLAAKRIFRQSAGLVCHLDT